MLRDIGHFKTKLGHVDGFGDTGDFLIDIIKSKQVRSASPPPSGETEEGSNEGETGAGRDEEGQ